jgi:hypothetical protein
MSLQVFSAVFSLLAVQLRATDTDEATIRGYFLALKDVPLEAVSVSAQTFAKEPGRRFFPTTAEWFQVAQQASVDALRKALPPARDEPWHFACDLCEDTGWEPYGCPGDATCGRKFRHAAHHYVRACPCRPVNQTWQRHQRFGRGA